MYLIYDVMNDCVVDSADTEMQAQLLLNYYYQLCDNVDCDFEIIKEYD